MTDDTFYEDEQQDNEALILKLKKVLFEICKTAPDGWDEAYEMALDEHGPLLVDVFSENPIETETAFQEFYEFDDYEDPESGECMSFADWSEFFCNQSREQLSQAIFDLLKTGTSLEDILSTLKSEQDTLASQFSIRSIGDLNEFLEDNEYRDGILEIEQSLLEWKDFFEKDEFGLYLTCEDLTKENRILTQKLENIQGIVAPND